MSERVAYAHFFARCFLSLLMTKKQCLSEYLHHNLFTMDNTSKPPEDHHHHHQQQQDGTSNSNPDPTSNPNDEINSNDVVDADCDDKKWKNVNRIKIKIPLEQRRDGSISDIIAQKMLIQYDETKDKDEKDAFLSKHNVVQLLDDDDDDDDDEDYDEEKEKEAEEPTKAPPANNIGVSTSASSASPTPPTTTNTSRGDNKSAEGTISRRMIHDLSLTKEILLFRHQEGRRILPALELDTIKTLPPDTKIKVINRRTGKVMESRVPVSQLPEMLAKDASLEPIIESTDDDYSSVADNNDTAQVARSNPRATISLGIRRQKRMKSRFTKGEIVSITEGPNAGSVASFQDYLTAGWARLKTIPQGPVLIVHKDFFVRIAEAKRKNKRRKVIPDLVNIISAGRSK